MNQRVIDAKSEYTVGSYYGSRNIEGISQDLGMELLKMMLGCGGDLWAKDYYETSIYDHLSHPEKIRFSRTGNEEFVRVVKGFWDV